MDTKKVKKSSDETGMVMSSPEEFVKIFNGSKPIDRVLIANNGIAAVKCIRSIRRWAYDMFGNERAIRFKVMVTPEDLKANAEYFKLADMHYPVPGGSNNNNYANVDLIVDLAKHHNIPAVWAGWGHASENPRLPELLEENGIAFIGPRESAMRTLGDKIASTIIAQTLDIPTLPWSGSDLRLDTTTISTSSVITVPSALYNKASIFNHEQGIMVAKVIGYPVMIKASEGGGGKGIRKATCESEFASFFKQVQTEVPGSPIFLMKVLSRARHVEVQLLGDNYGQAITLFGRDCSVQRRHQKIIEEGPAIICSPEIMQRMETDAKRLARFVRYNSAGTVEYLYDSTEKVYYFLELNSRLQVEHPCTEMIANINLPACQLQIAMGIPLHRIQDVRNLYCLGPWGDTPIDFDNPEKVPTPKGHVIAARITAENPEEGFIPGSGTVKHINFQNSKNTWGYFSIHAEGSLHEYADSQFGHIFAWGENRDIARKDLILALKELSIHGDFRTTVEYLVNLLETDHYLRNKIHINWLDNLIADKVVSERPDALTAVICGVLHIADASFSSKLSVYHKALERGQIPSASSLIMAEKVELIYEGFRYQMQVNKLGPSSYFMVLNNTFTEVEAHRMRDGSLLVSYNGASHTSYMREEVSGYRVVIGGKTCIFQKENDPTLLRAPSAGKLVSYMVEDGGHVFQGKAYCEMEVMKMLMPLTASESGCVHYVKSPGAILDAGVVIARLAVDDPTRILQAEPHVGVFPTSTRESACRKRLSQAFKEIKGRLLNIMHGYCAADEFFEVKLERDFCALVKALRDPSLPLLELQDIMSSLSGRIPLIVEDEIKKCLSKYASNMTSVMTQFPSMQIANVVDTYAASLQKRQERDNFFQNTSAIVQLVQEYRNGLQGHRKSVLHGMIKDYLGVEALFSEDNFEKSVSSLLNKKDCDLDAVVSSVMSHAAYAKKNSLVIKLIDELCSCNPSTVGDDIHLVLQELTHLNRKEHAKVTLKARQVLIASHKPSFELRYNQFEKIFLSCVDVNALQPPAEGLQKIIWSETAVFDILPSFFFHRNEAVRMAAVEVYIRRSYQAYELTTVEHVKFGTLNLMEFQFYLPANHPNRQLPLSFSERVELHRVRSISDEMFDASLRQPSTEPSCERKGIMVVFDSFQEFRDNVGTLLTVLNQGTNSPVPYLDGLSKTTSKSFFIPDKFSGFELRQIAEEPKHIVNLCIRMKSALLKDQEEYQNLCFREIEEKKNELKIHGVRRFSFILTDCKGEFPLYYTFRARDDYKEDTIYRHLEPALAYQLELSRMHMFDLVSIPCENPNMHMYFGSAKKMSADQKVTDQRFFIRSILRHSDFLTKEASFEYLEKASEIQLLEALDQLELSLNKMRKRTDCNHVFLNYVPCIVIEPQKIEEAIRATVYRHGPRLWRLRVLMAEMKMVIRTSPGKPKMPLRMLLSTESGFNLEVAMYREVEDPRTGKLVFQSFGEKQGPMHGLPVNTPYLTQDHLQFKRNVAQNQGTTYVYDFPHLLLQALKDDWASFVKIHPSVQVPKEMILTEEISLDFNSELTTVSRLSGENDIGVVGWLLTLFTPEYPEGRKIVMVANDVTSVMGSFATLENTLFLKAARHARHNGYPFIYLAASSGARIGLAEEVRHLFRVAWVDPSCPEKGIRYLYLTSSDYNKLNSSNSVHVTPVEEDGELRLKIIDIIGKDQDIGVENLKGSAAMAGEFSECYEKIFTISLVTCRAVGIGAYLVRLGQRVVQVDSSHILLTGASALNKVLGRKVYTSHHQLGGPQIMFHNGVSHCVVSDDYHGIQLILKWLSYVPKTSSADPPVHPISDPVDRVIQVLPTRSPYDPRHLINGRMSLDSAGVWEGGLFDKGSFMETMAGWAQTVVVGRARLGGISVGVITAETRPVETVIPADPADPNSEAKVTVQVGQVWFPDSSYKTAQAINDMNRERLPLFILANWRGFSGGMKDMFDQVLKYGAMIVDALRQYNQPVIVYIPQYAELRGGAWVVIDPSINPSWMEMYADPESRGNILEAAGLVEVKFKSPALIQAMRRIDQRCSVICSSLSRTDLAHADRQKLEAELRQREEDLMPVYTQVATLFADLHDTPGRMQERNVISDIVPWRTSRKYFYWRLKRLILQGKVRRMVEETYIDKASVKNVNSLLERWHAESVGPANSYLWSDNESVAKWLEAQLSSDTCSHVLEQVRWLRQQTSVSQILSLVQGSPDIALNAIIQLTKQVKAVNRKELPRIMEVLTSINAEGEPDPTSADN